MRKDETMSKGFDKTRIDHRTKEEYSTLVERNLK
jgi:hypothetical protein